MKRIFEGGQATFSFWRFFEDTRRELHKNSLFLVYKHSNFYCIQNSAFRFALGNKIADIECFSFHLMYQPLMSKIKQTRAKDQENKWILVGNGKLNEIVECWRCFVLFKIDLRCRSEITVNKVALAIVSRFTFSLCDSHVTQQY